MRLFDLKPKDLLPSFLDEYNDVIPIDKDKAIRIIATGKKFYEKKLPEGYSSYQSYLEQYWYDGLGKSPTDYSVYDDEYYFTDLWLCWTQYSRGYIRSIEHPKSLDENNTVYSILESVKSIADLGCGIGYTTASLKQMFPDATVYGTNLKETRQYKFCEYMSNKSDFNLVNDIWEIDTPVDLVFASEYFEHIWDSTDHLYSVITKLKPKYLFIANSFNTRSVGHFNRYMSNVDGVGNIYDQKDMTRTFNKVLTNNGYKRVKTKLWNNKPALWEKI